MDTIKDSEKGFILLSSLVFGAAMASLLAYLFLDYNSNRDITLSNLLALRKRNELSQQLDQSFYQEGRGSQIVRTISVQNNNLTGRLIVKEKQLGHRTPNWSYLEQAPYHPCTVPSGGLDRFSSNKSCSDIPVFTNYLGGNLRAPSDIILESSRLFIRGAVWVDSSLLIKGNHQVVEIITIGDMFVSEIRLAENSSVQKILLYSAAGKIELENISNKLTLCNEDNEGRNGTLSERVRLTILGPKAKVVEGLVFSHTDIVGCPYRFDEQVWPQSTLLAIKSP